MEVTGRAAHNKSLDASGGSVFRDLIRPAMLEWTCAAASTLTLALHSSLGARMTDPVSTAIC
jgi:hypothetical protein